MIYLYKESRNSSKMSGELEYWKASQCENIRCRDAIDKAIKDNFDGSHLSDKGAKKVIAEFGYDRTMWVLSASILNKTYDGRFSNENKDWAKTIIPTYISKDDYQEYSSDYHPTVLDGFIDQVKREYLKLELVGYSHCEKHKEPQDYEGKLLILKPELLSEEYKNPVNQYFMAKSGFGCNPNALGRKVFGYFLCDGEQTQFYREDFVGVADLEQLPEWAENKLAGIEQVQQDTMEMEII